MITPLFSLKYRIRFPNESQYLDWLRVIDKNCECKEHKAPPVAAVSEEQEANVDTMQLSDDDEEELTMLREVRTLHLLLNCVLTIVCCTEKCECAQGGCSVLSQENFHGRSACQGCG